MKKLTFAFAALCIFAGCQKEVTQTAKTREVIPNIRFTASAPDTKVNFYQEKEAPYDMQCRWEAGDVIFGFKDDGTQFQFSVASVDSKTHVATLEQTTGVEFAAGDVLHAIHFPGKTAADLEDGTLKVDFSEQPGDVVPILLFCDVTVERETVNLVFDHPCSLLSFRSAVVPNKGKTIKKLVLSGHEIVSSGTVSVLGGALRFTADLPSKFITKTVSGITTDINTGELTGNITIVVPPCTIEKATILATSYYSTYAIGKTAESGNFYALDNKEFTKLTLPESSSVICGGVEWAKTNLQYKTATAGGDIASWGGDFIYTDLTTSPITFKNGYSDGFKLSAITTPYYNGSSYIKYNEADGKTELDPVDDLVQLCYPGTGWRMPGKEEFESLINASWKEKAWGNPTKLTNDNGTLSFPRGQYGSDGTALNQTALYWTRTLYKDTPKNAHYFKLNSSSLSIGSKTRNLALSIRPVKPAN